MEDIFKCICEFGDSHYWLRSFFKQVVFFLKRILANRVLYDENHIHFFDDAIKIATWKEIAYDYKGQFIQSDSSDGDCEDGCCLKLGQKLAQHHLTRIIRSLRPKSQTTANDSAKISVVDSMEQAEISEGGLIDFLHIVAFVLECIVANPVLYDRKSEQYHDEPFKLKVWNEICTVFHDKVQSNELELGDEDVNFEIKHMQKTIERHLHRMINPLNMIQKASKADLNRLAIDIESSSDTECNGNESVTVTHGRLSKSKQPVTINIAPNKTGSQTVNIILNDSPVSRKSGENMLIEPKNDRERSHIVDQLVAVERTLTPIERTDSRSSQGDRAQKRNNGSDKDRSPETLKRKKSENENEREQKRSSEEDLSPEVEPHKKHRSDVSQLLERPARIKSVIQKKDASNDTHKAHNFRRK